MKRPLRPICVLTVAILLVTAVLLWLRRDSGTHAGADPASRDARSATELPRPGPTESSPVARDVTSVATAPLAIPATADVVESIPTPARQFDAWMENYFAAKAAGRAGLVADGEALARLRREYLLGLIKTDPEAALKAAVPAHVLDELPVSVRALLEERVSGRGYFGVTVANYPEQGRSEVSREFRVNGRYYEAFVYGRRLSDVTRESATLFGIALTDPTNSKRRLMAVHEDSVRQLDYLEAQRLSRKPENCKISGLPVEANGAPLFAEVGGKVEGFCGASHLLSLNQRLASDGGVYVDGVEPPIAHDGWTQGPKAVLFMRVTYPDDPTEPITESGAYQLMDAVNAWFVETSYDTISFVTDVTPLMVLPQTKAWYCENGDGDLLSDARQVARTYGYDTDNYPLDIVRFPSPGSGCDGYGYGGKASVRGKNCWMLSNSAGTQIHELGHNLGVWHANFWTGVGEGVISQGSHVEYGNSFDVMGSSGSQGQFNAAFKNILDWMQEPFVQTVTESGTYRIHTFDQLSLTPGQKYALKIRKDYDRNYWAEFRQKFNNRWFLNGVMLNWDPWNNGVTNSGSGTHLLDTTPGTPTSSSSKEDSPVIVGRTFSDVAAGVHLTPIARGTDSPDNWIDVVVNLGLFPSNVPPVAGITADRTTVAVNEVVNFAAIASDPDGDALAYGWDFGDLNFGPNSPNVSKSWSSAGEYVVRCVVSDMKGGINSHNVVITVGSPTTFRASGRITVDGVPLEGVRVHNNLSGASQRWGYTDSDGNYVIARLAAGNPTISAVKYGYVLTRAGWNSPITVGPSAAGLNWTGTALPRVGMTVTDDTVSEAGLNSGVITFTRTGSTESNLVVKLNRTGTAANGSDYTLSPAPAGGPLQLTIPAGLSSLDVTLTPQGDSTSEGPESVALTLIEDAAYIIAPSSEVILTIQDDDPSVRPTINVTANNSGGPDNDNVATESGSDLAIFRLVRSGNVANEIAVLYSVTGSASAGEDYEALDGIAVIPPGQSSVNIPLTAIDDLEVEGFETVTVSLLSSAAYTVGNQVSATITIVDDDPATVTITATDNLAAETGGNNATFAIARSGSLAANLEVHYSVAGSATSGSDFNPLSGFVTIPSGEANVTLSVVAINDSAVEGAETIVINLSSSPTYNVGNPGSAQATLLDDETPTVTLVVADSTATEPGTDTGAFRFTRTGETSGSLTVFYGVAGTAVPGIDYAAFGGGIVIPAGSSDVILTVTPLDDTVPEAVERVLVQLQPSPDYNVGTAAPQGVNLRDNDSGLPAVGFSYAAFSGPESDTSVEISVQLSTNTTSTVTVGYSVTGGTATGGGTDYNLASGTLRFLPTTNNQTIAFVVNNDVLAESDETIFISLSNPINAQLDALATLTYTIQDDDGSGNVTVTAIDSLGAESGPDTGTFRIARSGGNSSEVVVPFQVVGSASSPADFLPLGNYAVIPSGVSFVDIVVTPVDDDTDETNETVVLNLLPFVGGKLGSPDIATISILDNDSAASLPVVSVAATDPTAAEPGVDTGQFTVTRDRGTNEALVVTFTVGGSATSGGDFTPIGTTVTIPEGAFAAPVTLTALDDSTFESNETVVVTLSMPATYLVGKPSTATVVIQDDEAGVSVVAEGSPSEDGETSGAFIVSRTGAITTPLAVNFGLGGTADPTDFQSLGTSVVIPAGTNAVAVPVLPVNDLVPEGNETVVLTLQPGAAYAVASPNSATLVLVDDEPAISVAATDSLAYEGGGDGAAFTLSRAGTLVNALTVYFSVGGTAVNGVDYQPIPESVIIPAGVRSVELPVVPIDDLEVESSETVEVTLLPDSAYALLSPNSAQVIITDDEVNLLPEVTIISPTVDTVYLVNVGTMLVLEATATDDGRPNPPSVLTTTWSRVSGPGTVTFGESNALWTTVKFSANGVYILRITADDGQLSASDDLTVVVSPDGALSSGLQAYWKFDEVAGASAFDSSGSGRNATLANGALFAQGRFGNSLELDGVNDVASFASMPLSQLTVTAWIRADSQGDSTTPRVLAMPGYNIRIRRATGSTTNSVALESQRSTTTGEWRTPGDVVSDGAWYHISVAYDSASTANEPVFHVNGQLQGTIERTGPAGSQVSNTGTGYIGNAGALDRSWDGRIDDMRIYNRLLSASEIQIIAAGPPTNLAPRLNAGLPQTVSVNGTIALQGVILDDGQPSPPGVVAALWTQASGPGTVEFDDPSALDATATFSAGGTYVLRLFADDGQVQVADDVEITVTAPTRVSIMAVNNTAAEFGAPGSTSPVTTPGTFTVTREGDTSQELPVLLAIDGTASNGVDYLTLTNVVVIPAGLSSASFDVVPVSDGLAEGEESVEVTVLPDSSYLVGTPTADTVVIQDAPFDEWRLTRFTTAELLDPDISGPLADPDLDGLRILLEYACGFEPRVADASDGFSGAMETVSGISGSRSAYVVRFHRRLGAPDLIYEVQVSPDMNNWNSGPNYSRVVSPPIDDGNGITETIRVEIFGNMASSGQRFVRLRVRLQ